MSFETLAQSDKPALPTSAIASDCRHYRGDKPCIQNRVCTGCQSYDPFVNRICIVKLGALGDVVRTLCILPALTKKYPNAHITWVSKPAGCRMIQDHSQITRTLEFGPITAMMLSQEHFDLVVSLDKEPEPCALAMNLKADKKIGIGMSAHGTPVPLNDEAHDYFLLGLSDDLKFNKNTKSYPQLVHEALGLSYDWSPYELPVNDMRREQLRQSLLAHHGTHTGSELSVVGVNVGAGKVFANKMWSPSMTAQAIRLFKQNNADTSVLLLGGPDEREAVDAILADLSSTQDDTHVIDAGTEHDEASFVALVDLCDVLFSGDTMALHVAVARKKAVVGFFGPTCEQEIELFGRGIKLVANTACSPCYKRSCDHNDECLKQITPQMAADAMTALLTQSRQGRLPLSLPQMPSRKAG